MKAYTFIACCIGDDCCPRPHLWQQRVEGPSVAKARAKLISIMKKGGFRPYEIVEITTAMKEHPVVEVKL